MSFEPDPSRARPVVQRRRRRGALAPTLAVLGVLVVLSLVLASVWTDVLWYDQLGYASVYRTELLTQVALFVTGALVMAGAVLGGLVLAYRSRPIYAPVSTEQVSLDRYRDTIEPLRRLVVIAVPVTLGLFAGSAASQQWQTLLLWWNRVPFGRDDAQFGLDIGFFVFTLPWLQFVVGFLSTVVFLAALGSVVTHYLYGGLRLQGAGQRMTSAARVQLAALAAAFLLLRAADYWLGRYDLATKDSRLITGLTYTDANATLTARGILAAIAVIVALLFVVAAVVERFRLLPLVGVALLVISAVVIGAIFPAVVQRFQVTPSAATLEQPYIQRNIEATREAYGLGGVQVTDYPARTTASQAALRKDADTLPGIRLIDPTLVSDTFRQLEQNKQYYSFADSLDVDRYTVQGRRRDTVIAVRELSLEGVPQAQRNWVNDHTLYTHGFGVVAAYGNERTSDGQPNFFQKGIPSTGELGTYEPRVYFGEESPDYSIVGGRADGPKREIDFPDKSSSGEARTTYTGTGGVAIDSAVNKLLYALKFREQNILLSDAVGDGSRIMYDRNPRDRVKAVAPYLTMDGDPYPAVVDGKVVWILDGYTTTDRYPYSKQTDLREVTSDSTTASTSSVVALQDQTVNYVRNSVKATVDAYDGSVKLFTWDATDPVLKAWQKIFPATVRPLSDIDGGLMSHMRYPEDLFKVQRTLLSKYHVTEAGAFFGGQDYWQVPADPTASTPTVQQPPYYLTLAMPGQDAPTFSLTSTFIPNGGARSVLTGFLAVDADAGATAGVKRDGYGALRLLQLPRDAVVPGPGQVQNNFNADTNVTTVLNLLRGGGSKVENGNLLTLPVGDGLLYVQPVYVRGSGQTSYPLLQRVLVGFGNQIGFADTLDKALNQVFSGTGTPSPGGGGTPTPPPTGGSSPSATGSVSPSVPASAQVALQTALADAQRAIAAADAALKAGDFAAYGTAQKDLGDAIDRAVAAQNRLTPGRAAPASPAPSRTPTPTPTGTG